MARIRSPGYPSFPLEQVVDFASKIHAQDRQHPLDRETAARHIGFAGLSGASDRALSALIHFGLAERVQKGELRITDGALRILHPNNTQERRVALHEAGFQPDLFKELRDRYPEGPPSKESLGSYLLRSGFASAAIPAATKAYLETCYFLQRERAYEFDVAGGHDAPEQEPEPQPEPVPMQTAAVPTPSAAPPRVPAAVVQEPHTPTASRTMVRNEIYLDFRGSREVHVEGLLDLNGILELEEKLKAVKMLLKPPAQPAREQIEDDEQRH